MAEFLTGIEPLRRRARANIKQGPITSAYGADRERVIAVLNEALATEEQAHADQIALRRTQLQGEPNFDPEGLATRVQRQP